VTAGVEVVRRGALELFVSGPPMQAPAELEGRIQELWEAEKAVRPSIVNGSIVCFGARTGGRVDARLAEYRLFIARERDSSIRLRLGLQAIGVTGVVVDSAGKILVGHRGADVTEYPGALELVPSGSLASDSVGENGRVDTLGALLSELEEETGIERASVASVVPLGMLRDTDQDGFDICYELHLAAGATLSAFAAGEYRDLALLDGSEVAALIADGRPAVPTSRALLELRVPR